MILWKYSTESSLRKGTKVQFIPDETIFGKYKFRNEYVAKMLKNYVYLNTGLTILFNGEKFHSKNIDPIKPILKKLNIKNYNVNGYQFSSDLIQVKKIRDLVGAENSLLVRNGGLLNFNYETFIGPSYAAILYVLVRRENQCYWKCP